MIFCSYKQLLNARLSFEKCSACPRRDTRHRPKRRTNKIQLHRNMHICPPNKNKENRTVTIKGNWSLVELMSAPIHYNPNINGRFGAALINTPETILALRDANRSQARMIRTSAERTRVCQEYYNTSVKMAKMKCTHFIHLLKGPKQKYWPCLYIDL